MLTYGSYFEKLQSTLSNYSLLIYYFINNLINNLNLINQSDPCYINLCVGKVLVKSF